MNSYDSELRTLVRVTTRYLKWKYSHDKALLNEIDFALVDICKSYYDIYGEDNKPKIADTKNSTDVVQVGKFRFPKGLKTSSKSNTRIKSTFDNEPDINYSDIENMDFEDKIKRIIDEYLNGASITKLSSKYGISPATIRSHVKRISKF